jgi:IS5 family transposase
VVDATIIAAPSSTKNQKGERDPEMHQTKKGNQWHFGMKAPIGVDAESVLVHTLVTTAANTNDVTQAHALLQGEEREENQTPDVKWHVAMRPGKRRSLPENELGRIEEKIEKLKASMRAKVEHPFHIIKNIFQLKKVRYRGLVKNTAQLLTLFGLASLLIAKRRIWALHAQGAS